MTVSEIIECMRLCYVDEKVMIEDENGNLHDFTMLIKSRDGASVIITKKQEGRDGQ